MNREFRILSFVLIGCAACGGTGGDSNAGPDGGAGSNGSNGSNGSSETKAGFITIESTRYTVSSTDVEQGYASGTVYRIPPIMTGGTSPCTTTTVGACQLQTCSTSGSGSGSGGDVPITYTDSGLMTISGVQVNDGTMTLTPGAYGYTTVSGAVALFNGGDTVRFVAPGNPQGAPAFDVSLVAPTSVQVTSPSFVQGSVAASAAQDLGVAWSGPATSDVTVQLAGGTAGTSASARCSFSGSAGHGVVPAGALAAIRDVGGNASIIISAESKATRSPNDWQLSFSLLTYGLIPSGIAAGTLALQ